MGEKILMDKDNVVDVARIVSESDDYQSFMKGMAIHAFLLEAQKATAQPQQPKPQQQTQAPPKPSPRPVPQPPQPPRRQIREPDNNPQPADGSDDANFEAGEEAEFENQEF